MAPLNSSDFNGYNDSYAVPAGGSEIFSGSVDIILSTGITQQVIDTFFKYCFEMYSLCGK